MEQAIGLNAAQMDFLQLLAHIKTTEELEELRAVVSTAGRSWSDPVLNSDGSVNMDASRRVEILFRLKDEEMVEQMIEILNS
jgi:chemotaxis protein MotB